MSEHLVVKSVIDAENIVTEFELKSTTKFTIFRRNKGFSHDFDYADIKGHRVLWEDRGQDEGDKALPYDGIPFIVLGYDVRECHFGPDRNESKKKKQQAEKNMEKNKDHAYSQKSRVLMQNTKKLNCPARIYMRKICKFPKYKIVGPDSSFKRKKQARELKKDMSSQKEMDRVEEYHVFLPGPESHKNHVTGQLAGTCLPVDKVIKEHITTLMEEGVSKVAEMKRHLKSFSRKELRIGDEENRRFYPSDKAIRNTMNSIKDRTRFSSDDKENLQEMVDRFKASNSEDSFYLNISSYVDYNARSLETIKAYASVVPRFLRNRPKMLVEHCVKRIPPHVEMAAEKDIQQCMDGKFQVKSLNSDNVYDIDLSAHCPSCSCPDWKKHRLPCKHMLAIFHHFPAWDWDFLPSDYRDAPHFNLDFEVLNQLQDIFPTHQTCPGELLNQQEQSGRGRGKKRPFPKEPEVTPLTNDWEKCRELVKTIQSRLMNSYGHDLSTIVGPLQQVADQLKEIKPKDDDLPVIRPLKRKRVPNKCGNIRKTGVLNSSGLPHQRSKRKLLRKQKKGPGERIDQGIMKNLQSCVAADTNDIEVSKELNRIWNQKENSGYIIAKCGGVNITDEDIASLNGSNWLTDQVIDSYLGAIAEAETEKGNRVLRILTSTMTSILEGGCLQNMTLRNVKLDEYNGVIGAYLQRMGHWNLVVIEPKSRQIAFYNPLGETMHQKTMILQNWSRFFHQRVSLDLESGESSNRWTLNTVNHSKQQDDYNCGVYVLLFCETHLSKETPDRITAEVLKSSRMRIAKHLLMYQVYLKDCCPSCGFEIQQSQNEIRCEICNRKFHKLPFCLKEEVHFDHFTCRQCSLSIGDEVSTEFHDYAPCDDQMEEEHTHQCSTSDNLHSPGQAVDILRPFREAVLKSNFSENDCSEMVDAMKHCGWNSISNTAQALGKELPPFPNHIQLFSGYQCLGNFGDGLVLLVN